MIRRAILAIICLFVLIWIAGAHLLKSRLLTLVNNHQSDNLNISYKDASIGGFPFSWKITLTSPKITLINQDISQELSSDSLACSFSYGLGSTELKLGKVLYYFTEDGESSKNYKLQSQDDIAFTVNFFENFYKADSSASLKKLLKDVSFTNSSVNALTDKGEELFILSALNLFIQKNIASNSNEFFVLKLSGDYKASFEDRRINNLALSLDGSYAVNDGDVENKLDFERRVEINFAKIDVNETYCELKGALNLARNHPPQGKISVELMNYEEFADILVPSDFIFSNSYLKRMIAKAAPAGPNNEKTDKVSFDIEFSDEGVTIGQVNMIDLN